MGRGRGAWEHGSVGRGAWEHGSMEWGAWEHGSMGRGAWEHGEGEHGSMGSLPRPVLQTQKAVTRNTVLHSLHENL